MDNHKNLFDYLAQIFTIFGFTTLVLCGSCFLFGEDAKGYSSIFDLGGGGVSCGTLLQFLALSAVMTLLRCLFFTDRFIRRMSVTLRTVCMAVLAVAFVGLFSYLFAWFPIGEWRPWLAFFLCFTVGFTVSILASALKEKAENKALAEALKKLQEDTTNE